MTAKQNMGWLRQLSELRSAVAELTRVTQAQTGKMFEMGAEVTALKAQVQELQKHNNGNGKGGGK